MKKFLLILLTLLVCVCSFVGISACSKDDEEDSGYGIVEDDEAHYLVFLVESSTLATMHVISTDTYESLKPYFPLIPEREGYIGEWEVIDEVYSEDTNYIYINAYYYKIQE